MRAGARGEAELRGRLSDKNCDRVFVLRAGDPNVNRFGASCLEQSVGLLDLDFRVVLTATLVTL